MHKLAPSGSAVTADNTRQSTFSIGGVAFSEHGGSVDKTHTRFAYKKQAIAYGPRFFKVGNPVPPSLTLEVLILASGRERLVR